MPPPSKRRKLSTATEESVSWDELGNVEPLARHSHHIEYLPTAEPPSLPRRVEKVHLEIRNLPYASSERKKLHRRQGTAAAADEVASVATVIVSAAVDDFGATVGLTTIVSESELGVFPTTSTTTLIGRPGTTSSLPEATESSPAPASSLPTSAAETAVGSSDVPIDVAQAFTTLPDGIGSSGDIPTSTFSEDAVPETTSGIVLVSSVLVSDVASEAFTAVPTTTTIGFEDSDSASVTSIPASMTGSSSLDSLNRTISATTESASLASQSSVNPSSLTSLLVSTTESASLASQSTVNPSSLAGSPSLTSAPASASTTAPESSLLPFGVFFATLEDGTVTRLTRSSEPYTTTFSDGRVSTIVPFSSSGPRSSPLSTVTDGDRTSVVFSTQTLAADTSRIAASTIYSTDIAGVGAVGTAGTLDETPVSSASASATNNNNDDSDDSPPTPVLAGGVVGGVAGLAVVVLIAMFFIRWYRRRGHLGGHHALPSGAAMPPGHDADTGDSMGGGSSRNPGMAERAGLMPLAGAVPGFFRHINRSSEQPSEPSERGFTRVSGRKLPSAFSEGMSNHNPQAMPLNYTDHDRNLSSTSFYRDSAGFYGGDGEDDGPNTPMRRNAPGGENIMLSPGPRRTPTVKHGGPYTMRPSTVSPSTPPPGTAATYGRSDTPGSAERGSRFTEQV